MATESTTTDTKVTTVREVTMTEFRGIINAGLTTLGLTPLSDQGEAGDDDWIGINGATISLNDAAAMVTIASADAETS